MAQHISLGRLGEKLAAIYLVNKGFSILHQNWRHQHLEIDIIAVEGKILHFIEVKTRRSTAFGYPEQSITAKKMLNLTLAAEEYQYQNPQWKLIQFDILSILLNHDGTEEYFFIEDVDV